MWRSGYAKWCTLTFVLTLALLSSLGILSSVQTIPGQLVQRLFDVSHNSRKEPDVLKVSEVRESSVGVPLEASLSFPPDMSETVGKWLSTWSSEMRDEFRRLVDDDVSEDDPRLLHHIRRMIIPPATHKTRKVSLFILETLQSKAVEEVLKGKKGGFFIECGALDGERSSNTIDLEDGKGWNGLLVEADPYYFLTLLGRNRKAHSINACLAVTNKPSFMHFREDVGGEGKLVDLGAIEVPCYPTYSLMLAMNVSKVDYFSLDVEGAELSILNTIPFNKLDISVLTVEVTHGEHQHNTTKLMQENGYVAHKHIKGLDMKIHYVADDILFVKKNLV